MSLVNFKNSTCNIKVDLSLDSFGRAKIIFNQDDTIPAESIILGGFTELNEHNLIEQSDFSDMNYIYQKIDDFTYILTKDVDDIYVEPEIPDENNPDFIPEDHVPTVDEIRNEKIHCLSSTCNNLIKYGIDINIDGVTEHFSYTEEDQTNIKELFDLAIQTNIPMYYHSDGNSCKSYTVEQIIELYTNASMNKMHHITYFNQLKMYINTLDNLEDIRAIEYGFELSEEYLDTYNAAMDQARIGMETLLKSGMNELRKNY